MRVTKYLILSVAACFLQSAWAAEEVGVTPYRPSESNSAQLPTPGHLELEVGGLRVKNGEARNDSLPYLFKLALSREWGVLLGGDAYVWSRAAPGFRVKGIGDTTMTLKRAWIVDEDTAFGLEFATKFPTAKNGLGSDKAEYILNGIYSKDFGSIHLDANLNTTRIGLPESDTGRLQTGLSTAFSVAFSNDWSGTAEFSGVRRSGTPATAQLLAAIVYSPNKRFAIDVGLAKGITGASQDWSVFSGFVVPVAALW